MENFAIEKIFSMGKRDEEFCSRLNSIAEQGIKALQAGDKLKFNRKDLDFHNALITGCGNEYLTSEYKRCLLYTSNKSKGLLLIFPVMRL